MQGAVSYQVSAISFFYLKNYFYHKDHKVLNTKCTKEFGRLVLSYLSVNKIVAHSPPFGGVPKAGWFFKDKS